MNFHEKFLCNQVEIATQTRGELIRLLFFILTYYNIVFKMALYLDLEKINVYLLSVGKYFEAV